MKTKELFALVTTVAGNYFVFTLTNQTPSSPIRHHHSPRPRKVAVLSALSPGGAWKILTHPPTPKGIRRSKATRAQGRLWPPHGDHSATRGESQTGTPLQPRATVKSWPSSWQRLSAGHISHVTSYRLTDLRVGNACAPGMSAGGVTLTTTDLRVGMRKAANRLIHASQEPKPRSASAPR